MFSKKSTRFFRGNFYKRTVIRTSKLQWRFYMTPPFSDDSTRAKNRENSLASQFCGKIDLFILKLMQMYVQFVNSNVKIDSEQE